MILVDTSVWIEFLRDTGSSAWERVETLLDADIAICDAARMEVLAGARDEGHLQSLRGSLARAVLNSHIAQRLRQRGGPISPMSQKKVKWSAS